MYAPHFTRVQITKSLMTQTISEDVKNVDDQKLVAYVTVLAELAQRAPDPFESKSEEIMNFLVKQILMSPSPRDPVRFTSACLLL
jgi:sister chromatid cohesion protein PDS5